MNIGGNDVKSVLQKMAEDFQQEKYQSVIRVGDMLVEKKSILIKNLYALYFIARAYEKLYDFSRAVKYYSEILSLNEDELLAVEHEFEIDVDVDTRIFFFVGLELLGKSSFEEALRCFTLFLQYDEKHEGALYYAGQCCLQLGFLDDAIRYLNASGSAHADYTKFFALGCAFHLKGTVGLARDFYRQALHANPSLTEAKHNLNVLLNAGAEKETTSIIWRSTLEERLELSDYKQVPIFINSRDRLDCLKQLVEWLLSRGYCNIYVLDNKSTYLPLINYYKLLKTGPVRVIFLQANEGHQALWKAKILEQLQIDTPYVYTDSDVLPLEECPEDFILHMLKVLRQNSMIQKIGLSLRLDDVPQENYPENERQFWELEFAPNLYYAYTDTTFALYRGGRRFYINEAIRIGYPYMARHLPWYYNKQNLPVDEAYYVKRANTSSTYAKNYV